MSARRDDTARTRTMLLERARGRREALAEAWGEHAERPPCDARRDVSDASVPADVGAFVADAYPWRVDIAVIDDGRVCLVPDGDAWRLPGGPGARDETVERAAERYVSRAVGSDVALTDLLWTQLVEFDYGSVALPALRVVFRGTVADGANAGGEWFELETVPATCPDADALAAHI